MRLIDADALKDRFKLRINWLKKDVHSQYSLGLFHGAEYDAELVDEIPTITVDAVPVVRCRDCKMHYPEDAKHCKHCALTGVPVDGDDFCSYGEQCTDCSCSDDSAGIWLNWMS